MHAIYIYTEGLLYKGQIVNGNSSLTLLNEHRHWCMVWSSYPAIYIHIYLSTYLVYLLRRRFWYRISTRLTITSYSPFLPPILTLSNCSSHQTNDCSTIATRHNCPFHTMHRWTLHHLFILPFQILLIPENLPAQNFCQNSKTGYILTKKGNTLGFFVFWYQVFLLLC